MKTERVAVEIDSSSFASIKYKKRRLQYVQTQS